MKTMLIFSLVFTLLNLFVNAAPGADEANRHFNGPLKINPDNPCYFIDNSGKAVFLTGSHTWANFQEIGMDTTIRFDNKAYLDMMEQNHHNFMRLWMFENPSLACWTTDKLLWHPNIYEKAGPGKGSDSALKFDLAKFNQYYFDRLRQRAIDAGKRGIYVSVMLFQGWSLNKTKAEAGDPWKTHPWNKQNNVNNIGAKDSIADDGAKATIHSMKNPELLKIQEQYVIKVIETVNDLDNVLYEIINEGGTNDWQTYMTNFIRGHEKGMPKQHMIGMTAGGTIKYLNQQLYESNADWISPAQQPKDWMFPGTVFLEDYRENPPANTYGKVIILDTDHLWGHGGNWKWVWKSFARGHNPIFMDPWQPLTSNPDTAKVDWMSVGGVNKDQRDFPDWAPVRANMGHAALLASRLNMKDLKPIPEKASTGYCLTDNKTTFVVYLPEGGDVTLDMTAVTGSFSVEWFLPILNRTIVTGQSFPGKGYRAFTAPFSGDAVLILTKK
jgi:hypothetical protein